METYTLSTNELVLEGERRDAHVGGAQFRAVIVNDDTFGGITTMLATGAPSTK